MDEPVYHVVLEDRKIGPYNRRTIVGMRQKKALKSAQLLIAEDGSQLTVADLIKPRSHDSGFQHSRTSHSLVQATYAGRLAQVQGKGVDIPAFKGEIEVRVQSGVLRISGRVRSGLGWTHDRVKLPLNEVVYTRARGSLADLWLENKAADDLQRITVDMLTPHGVQALLEWVPRATSWPVEDEVSPDRKRKIVLASTVAAGTILAAVAVWVFVASNR